MPGEDIQDIRSGTSDQVSTIVKTPKFPPATAGVSSSPVTPAKPKSLQSQFKTRCFKCETPVNPRLYTCKVCGADLKGHRQKKLVERSLKAKTKGSQYLKSNNVHHIFDDLQKNISSLAGAGVIGAFLWFKVGPSGKRTSTGANTSDDVLAKAFATSDGKKTIKSLYQLYVTNKEDTAASETSTEKAKEDGLSETHLAVVPEDNSHDIHLHASDEMVSKDRIEVDSVVDSINEVTFGDNCSGEEESAVSPPCTSRAGKKRNQESPLKSTKKRRKTGKAGRHWMDVMLE